VADNSDERGKDGKENTAQHRDDLELEEPLGRVFRRPDSTDLQPCQSYTRHVGVRSSSSGRTEKGQGGSKRRVRNI